MKYKWIAKQFQTSFFNLRKWRVTAAEFNTFLLMKYFGKALKEFNLN